MLNKLPIKLFAGPSLSQSAAQMAKAQGIDLLPPIRRFDLPQLLDTGFIGIIIIADGYFYQDMAVGHAEIMAALKKDCDVFGLCSMGAIRAFEMQYYGMRGYGQVYNWFLKNDDFQDDEVALLHDAAPAYTPLSEPLVHFRECLHDLRKRSAINDHQSAAVLSRLKNRFFGERTLRLFEYLLHQHTPLNGKALLEQFDQYRIKLLDLNEFLRQQIYLKTAI